MGYMALTVLLLASLCGSAFGHAKLTYPPQRPWTYLVWDGGDMAPAWSCTAPMFGASQTSMRCHDNGDQSGVMTTITAGKTLTMAWEFGANHPGDCSVWISYDAAKAAPINWIKVASYPGCGAPDGLYPPNMKATWTITLPASLPPCDHCVLRWEWIAGHKVVDFEHYANCADVKIISDSKCTAPSNTVAINTGIQHLGGKCPYYNAYAAGFDKNRYPGPAVWNGACTGAPTTPPTTTPPASTGTSLTVYSDALSASFQDWSWSGGVANFKDFASTSVKYWGTNSIKFIPGNWNAIYIVCKTDGCIKAAAYGGLGFWLNGGTGTTGLMVRMRDSSSSEAAQTVVVTAKANTWKHIQISFDTNFRISNTAVLNGFHIQSSTSTTRPAVYIDGIVLIGRNTVVAPLLSDGSNTTSDGLQVDADGNIPDKNALVQPEGLDIDPVDPDVASAASTATPVAFALLALLACFAAV